MVIADKLKGTSRIEYLLYLWQVEDVIRAYGCDADRIRREYVSRFSLDDETRAKTEQWYADLCEMMRSEGVAGHGHMQICRNVLQELTELHAALLASPKFPYYREMYYKVLPYIVELRAKQPEGAPEQPELETCLQLLYGVMMLRVQKKAVSPETGKAAEDTAKLLGQLSDYYFKDKEQPIEF